MRTTKDDLEFHIEFAKKMISDRGELYPMVVGIIGTKRVTYPFVVSNDVDLRVQSNNIKDKLRRLGADSLVVLTEVWTVKLRHPALYSPDIDVRSHPDCKKSLLILYVKKISTVRVIIPIIKVFDSIEFGEQSIVIYKTVNDKQWGDTFKTGV